MSLVSILPQATQEVARQQPSVPSCSCCKASYPSQPSHHSQAPQHSDADALYGTDSMHFGDDYARLAGMKRPRPPRKEAAVRLTLGTRIRLLWPRDSTWQCGSVIKFDAKKALHTVRTDSGDAKRIDLRVIPWELLHGSHEGRHGFSPSGHDHGPSPDNAQSSHGHACNASSMPPPLSLGSHGLPGGAMQSPRNPNHSCSHYLHQTPSQQQQHQHQQRQEEHVGHVTSPQAGTGGWRVPPPSSASQLSGSGSKHPHCAAPSNHVNRSPLVLPASAAFVSPSHAAAGDAGRHCTCCSGKEGCHESQHHQQHQHQPQYPHQRQQLQHLRPLQHHQHQQHHPQRPHHQGHEACASEPNAASPAPLKHLPASSSAPAAAPSSLSLQASKALSTSSSLALAAPHPREDKAAAGAEGAALAFSSVAAMRGAGGVKPQPSRSMAAPPAPRSGLAALQSLSLPRSASCAAATGLLTLPSIRRPSGTLPPPASAPGAPAGPAPMPPHPHPSAAGRPSTPSAPSPGAAPCACSQCKTSPAAPHVPKHSMPAPAPPAPHLPSPRAGGTPSAAPRCSCCPAPSASAVPHAAVHSAPQQPRPAHHLVPSASAPPAPAPRPPLPSAQPGKPPLTSSLSLQLPRLPVLRPIPSPASSALLDRTSQLPAKLLHFPAPAAAPAAPAPAPPPAGPKPLLVTASRPPTLGPASPAAEKPTATRATPKVEGCRGPETGSSPAVADAAAGSRPGAFSLWKEAQHKPEETVAVTAAKAVPLFPLGIGSAGIASMEADALASGERAKEEQLMREGALVQAGERTTALRDAGNMDVCLDLRLPTLLPAPPAGAALEKQLSRRSSWTFQSDAAAKGKAAAPCQEPLLELTLSLPLLDSPGCDAKAATPAGSPCTAGEGEGSPPGAAPCSSTSCSSSEDQGQGQEEAEGHPQALQSKGGPGKEGEEQEDEEEEVMAAMALHFLKAESSPVAVAKSEEGRGKRKRAVLELPTSTDATELEAVGGPRSAAQLCDGAATIRKGEAEAERHAKAATPAHRERGVAVQQEPPAPCAAGEGCSCCYGKASIPDGAAGGLAVPLSAVGDHGSPGVPEAPRGAAGEGCAPEQQGADNPSPTSSCSSSSSINHMQQLALEKGEEGQRPLGAAHAMLHESAPPPAPLQQHHMPPSAGSLPNLLSLPRSLSAFVPPPVSFSQQPERRGFCPVPERLMQAFNQPAGAPVGPGPAVGQALQAMHS